MRRLGLSEPATAGTLEFLWHFTAESAPAGDVGRWADEDIAEACAWDRDPRELVAALSEEGWLDPSDDHRLIVHDWYEHADDTVHRAVWKARQRFVSGEAPRMSAITSSERPEAASCYGIDPPRRATGAPRKKRGGPRQARGVPMDQARPGQASSEQPPSVPPGGGRQGGPVVVQPSAAALELADWWRDVRLAVDPLASAHDGGRYDDGEIAWPVIRRREAESAQAMLANRTPEQIREVAGWATTQRVRDRSTGALPWAHQVLSLADVARQWPKLRGAMLAAREASTGPRDARDEALRREEASIWGSVS